MLASISMYMAYSLTSLLGNSIVLQRWRQRWCNVKQQCLWYSFQIYWFKFQEVTLFNGEKDTITTQQQMKQTKENGKFKLCQPVNMPSERWYPVVLCFVLDGIEWNEITVYWFNYKIPPILYETKCESIMYMKRHGQMPTKCKIQIESQQISTGIRFLNLIVSVLSRRHTFGL